jgi:uncharacterized protein YcfJ
MTVQAVKGISVLGAVAATLATGDALADGHGHGYGHGAYDHYGPDYVYARVVDVDPVVRYVTVDRPEQRCWNEAVRRPVPSANVAAQTAAGGIIGATIGHILGHGDSGALTVAGGAAGAVIAHENAIRNGAGYETRTGVVQRCETVSHPYTEKQFDGYRVTYMLDGRHYTTHTDYRPGDRIQVAVNARPVGYWGR